MTYISLSFLVFGATGSRFRRPAFNLSFSPFLISDIVFPIQILAGAGSQPLRRIWSIQAMGWSDSHEHISLDINFHCVIA